MRNGGIERTNAPKTKRTAAHPDGEAKSKASQGEKEKQVKNPAGRKTDSGSGKELKAHRKPTGTPRKDGTGRPQPYGQRSGDRNVQERQEKKVPSRCPVSGKCGGCQWIDLPYEEQLREKQKAVKKLLKPYCPVEPIVGMEDPLHYRNKVHAVFGREKGEVLSGIYQEGTHRIVPVESCLIENEQADAIIRDIRGLLKSFRIKTYNEDTGYGLLRHVLVRVGHASGEVMVVLVLGSPILPSKNHFVKALRELHPEITTIVLNVNDSRTSRILGERETTLYGKGYIEDTLCGCTFRISSKSFYQVNSVQTEILYTQAMRMANLTGKERVIDAYCGIGTISLIAASRAREVIGIERNPEAVRDAVANARRNGIRNVYFYEQDAGEFLTQMAESKDTADVVFLDPPRSGCDEAFLSALLRLQPKRVVYISCEPKTLERDLRYLTGCGYCAKEAVPVDMFPMCQNVETVALLSRVTE